MACVAISILHFRGNILFYGMAGGIFVSRALAEYALAILQKRDGWLVDGVYALRFFPHHQPGVSQLAIRNPCFHRRALLWMDLAEDRFDFCFGDCARTGGCDVAFPVYDRMIGERKHYGLRGVRS